VTIDLRTGAGRLWSLTSPGSPGRGERVEMMDRARELRRVVGCTLSPEIRIQLAGQPRFLVGATAKCLAKTNVRFHCWDYRRGMQLQNCDYRRGTPSPVPQRPVRGLWSSDERARPRSRTRSPRTAAASSGAASTSRSAGRSVPNQLQRREVRERLQQGRKVGTGPDLGDTRSGSHLAQNRRGWSSGTRHSVPA
jgi:hypothetical protein